MFGANKPFGSTTAFGQSSFGTTTPFGQTSTAFGAKPATNNVFGTSSFGTTSNTGSLFGTPAQQTSTGLFGQPSSTFGAPASTSTGTFGFGATSTSGGLFGSAAPSTQSSGGLFGSTTSAFGQPRLGFGGFGGTSTGTGLFGQSTSTTGTSLFGSTTGGFSSTTPTGTTIKFNPPSGTDTMMKGGVSTNIGTRHQCITCMKEYENKSLEELRVEDYAAGRKGPAATGMGFGTGTQQTSLFGSTPAASTSGFSFGNTTQSKPLFGTTGTTNAFGGSTGLFGQPAANQNTGLFGKQVTFGTATTSSTPAFNFGGTGTMGTGTSLFGQNNQSKPLFGQTTTPSTGLFGNPASTQSTGFGTSTGFGGFGTTNQQSTGLFGAKPTGFGTTNTTTTNSFSFGNTNQIGGGLFGSKPATSAFGGTGFGTQSTGFGSFGATSTSGTGLFGQTKPATSMFGNTGSTFGSGLGSSFGTSTFNTMGGLGTNTGTGLFGSTTANKAPGFNFGSSGSTGFNFGMNSNPSTFNFNPSSSMLGGTDPNASAALQAQQQILAMTANPFGDSPLFRNPIKDTSRESEVLKPTNPSAQKALLNDNQYKVALLPTAKIKPKPWTPTGKTYLFDGLEDEEPSLGVAFLPKKSVKKLVLKNNLRSNISSFTVTSDISNSGNQNSRIDVSISLSRSDANNSRLLTDSSPPIVPLSADESFDVNANKARKDVDVVTSSNTAKPVTNKSPSEEMLRKIPDRAIGHVNSSMDDSILALHTNKQNIGGRTFNILSESEDDTTTDKEQSVEDSWNLHNGSKGDNVESTTNKTGIILTRPEYYTEPQIDYLESLVDENGDCFVENFTIGRKGYGSVRFPGKMNVAGLNLDEIVHFRKKEINVYPDDSKKPPVGEELNRKAVVTLLNVWPTDKTTHCPIKNAERLCKMGYKEKIEKATSRLGAKFIDYDPETGSWKFEVDHFSKYGLEDSDEEMDVSKPPENDKAKIPPKQGELKANAEEASSNVTQRSVLKRKPISAVSSVDDEMPDAPFRPEMERDYFMNDSVFFNDILSPSRPLFSTHIDAQRIQGMKASFFHQDMNDDDWAYELPLEDNFSSRKDSDMKLYSSLGSSKLNESVSSLTKKQKYLDYEADQSYLSPIAAAKVSEPGIRSSMSTLSLNAKQNKCISSFPLVKTIHEQPSYVANQVPSLNKIKLKPLKESVLNGKDHLLADAGYFMGRSFRAGWRADGTIAVVLPPDTDSLPDSLPSYFLYDDSKTFPKKFTKSTGFTLALQKIAGYSTEEEQFMQKNLVEALNLQLKHSTSTVENDAPLFVPNPGVDLIHAHAELFEKHLKDSGIIAYDMSYTTQCVNVWNLLVSLWGRVKGLSDDLSVSNYAIQMARREAVSQWLIKTSETAVLREITKLNQDNYLSKIFLYLSCRRVYDAVKLAQKHKDFRLSLLLSQAEGTSVVRKWICSQLFNWEQNGAYKCIKYDRIRLYALLAGLLIWENVYETVNCCNNLDWKQVLALHLWYYCEPNASVQVAVEEYDKSFKGLDDNMKYSLPPYPSYINLLEKDIFDSVDDSQVTYDTCYHLLKLYCNRAHHLDQLLIPQTYTTDHLDYRLSWLLHLALSAVGYNISTDLASTLHVNFASQLESIDMWHWAIFVFLHHPDSEWRIKNVKDILLRHVSLDYCKENEEREKFIKEHLLVPEKWIFEAKAIKAHSLGKHAEEAWFLLKAGFWNKSHNIVIKYLAADAVINEDFDYLLKYLTELAVPERSATIIDWASGGQVYLDYINMCQVVKNVISMETSAYDLANFTPQVISLCSRLSSIPKPTIKDRLSVAEMAKKTATILRTIAMLEAEKTKNKTSIIHLASYLKILPMPHDYAVAENRFIANSFLQEVTSEMQIA